MMGKLIANPIDMFITWYYNPDTDEIISDEDYSLRSMDEEMDDWYEISTKLARELKNVTWVK